MDTSGKQGHELLADYLTIPRYDLYPDSSEIRQLSEEFLASHEIPGQPFGVFVIEGTDDFANLGRSVESFVFNDEFVGHTPAKMHELYDDYEANSRFYVVMDQHNRLPIATMRIGENTGAGLKTFVDLPKTPLGFTDKEICLAYNIDPQKCVDLTTWAIMPEHRDLIGDPTVRNLLFRTLYRQIISKQEQYTHMISIVDGKAQRSLWAYRFPFRRIFDSEPFEYETYLNNLAIIGTTSEFYSQAIFWVDKFRSESAINGSVLKSARADMIEEVASPVSRLDAMMAFN
jgi:hypothetical protein